MAYVITDETTALALRDAEAADAGYPAQGQRSGRRGVHPVAMTDDPTSPGWTRWVRQPLKHPSRADYALQVDAAPGAQTPTLNALVAARGLARIPALPQDWTRVEVEPEALAPKETKR